MSFHDFEAVLLAFIHRSNHFNDFYWVFNSYYLEIMFPVFLRFCFISRVFPVNDQNRMRKERKETDI